MSGWLLGQACCRSLVDLHPCTRCFTHGLLPSHEDCTERVKSLPFIGAGEEQDWELPASNSTQTFHNLSDVSRQDDGLYWMPQIPNETAIDSLRQPSMLFKMTIAETHSINATGICEAAEQLLSPDPELIYVVPPDIYSRCDLDLGCTITLTCIWHSYTFNHPILLSNGA